MRSMLGGAFLLAVCAGAVLILRWEWMFFWGPWIVAPLVVIGVLIDVLVMNRIQFRAYSFTVTSDYVYVARGRLFRRSATIPTSQILNVETVQRTRFAAETAERRDGEVMIFRRGVYTACEPCRDNPLRPPLWQIKASRIVHDQVTQTVSYRDARLEFFGLPVAYFPYFQHPDPSVKRKTGFLTPTIRHNVTRGYGITAPFFWALGPPQI
jgi:hypothetical protein